MRRRPRAAGAGAPYGGPPTAATLLASALLLDLSTLQRAVKDPSQVPLLARSVQGHTVVHALLSGLRVHKAGEISRAVSWPSTNLSLYRYDVVQTISAAAHSTLDALLRRMPELARTADLHGVTPLHIAGAEGSECLADLLLRAGARPTAVSQASDGNPR